MQLLSEAEDLILVRFHEKERDRTGAHPGQALPRQELLDLAGRNPDLDFEAAVESLVDRGYLDKEGEEYRFTDKAHDYMYTREPARV